MYIGTQHCTQSVPMVVTTVAANNTEGLNVHSGLVSACNSCDASARELEIFTTRWINSEASAGDKVELLAISAVITAPVPSSKSRARSSRSATTALTESISLGLSASIKISPPNRR